MKKSLIATLTVPMLAGLFTLPATAGWVETHAEGKVIIYSTGKIKETVPDEPKWFVIDLDDQSLLMVHNDRRIYSHGTIDDFCQAMEMSLRTAMATMSPEERALVDQLMGKDDPSAGRQPKVIIGKVGNTDPTAGLTTDKYMVLVDGKLYEELWFAPEAPAMKELDSAAIRNLEKKMTACTEHIAEIVAGTWLTQPEEDAAYQELMTKGWLMRRISYSDGLPLTEMVVASLERREISAAEFHSPPGFLWVPFEEFIFEE